MTNEQADRVANVVLAAAAVGAAVVVLKTPPLRRLAWRLAVTALTGLYPHGSAGRCSTPGPRAATAGYDRGVTATVGGRSATPPGGGVAHRAPCGDSADRTRRVARRHRDLQQQRPHLRILDCLLLAAVAVPLLPPRVLDHCQRHQLREDRPRCWPSCSATFPGSSSS